MVLTHKDGGKLAMLDWPLDRRDNYPPHRDDRCGHEGYGYLCWECTQFLGPYRMSHWDYHLRRRRQQAAGYGLPLKDNFLLRLAYELSHNPKLFAPIVQFLHSFSGETA